MLAGDASRPGVTSLVKLKHVGEGVNPNRGWQL